MKPNGETIFMIVSRRDACIALFFLVIGALSTYGGCYIQHRFNYASSPQAIVDSSQNGETFVKYRDGKAVELIFKPTDQNKVKK